MHNIPFSVPIGNVAMASMLDPSVAVKMLRDAPLEYGNNKALVLNALNCSECLCHVSDNLKNDKEVVRAAVVLYSSEFGYASDEIKDDGDFLLEIIARYSSSRLPSDIMQNSSRRLQNDKEFILVAIEQYEDAFIYCSKNVQGDMATALKAVQLKGTLLQFASDELRGSKEVVLTAIQESALAWQYASVELKDNKEVTLAAVLKDGNNLFYASPRLRSDPDVILAAVQNTGDALIHVCDNLKSSVAFMCMLVRVCNGKKLFRSHAQPTLRMKVKAFQQLFRTGSLLRWNPADMPTLSKLLNEKFEFRSVFLHLIHSSSSVASYDDHDDCRMKKAINVCAELIAEYAGVPIQAELTDLLLAREMLPLAIAYAGGRTTRVKPRRSIMACRL